MVVLTIRPPATLRPYYDLSCALAVFPLILWLAACSEPAPWSRWGFVALGLISYPVYMIHVPLYDMFSQLQPLAALGISVPAPLSGFLFLALLLVLGFALGGWYDKPMRRMMSMARVPRRIAADGPDARR